MVKISAPHPKPKPGDVGGQDNHPARENSEYAKDGRPVEAEPREKGDYEDPGKGRTGKGNASKGPWKDQGGAGHGSNYGAREERPKPSK
jgi:hypothetical protein